LPETPALAVAGRAYSGLTLVAQLSSSKRPHFRKPLNYVRCRTDCVHFYLYCSNVRKNIIPSLINNYQEMFMNKDQVKGRVEEAKGKVKEAAGVILDDEGMEIEGNIQKNVGKVQAGFGDLKEDVKDEAKRNKKNEC
jgi:uncharacterized protein YjbJ (UPF0337 family)